jgi:hypothetical protein
MFAGHFRKFVRMDASSHDSIVQYPIEISTANENEQTSPTIYTFFLYNLNVIMPKTFPKWSILKSEIITSIISGIISAQRLELTNGVSNLTTEIYLHPY